MKKRSSLSLLCGLALFSSCVVPSTPKWSPVSEAAEAEYRPYLAGGNSAIIGQAFVNLRGGILKASGRNVTLDPATSIGSEWWAKAGMSWDNRTLTPPSPLFLRARRTAMADADGRFKFTGLAPGSYFLRTEVRLEIGYEVEGGLLGSSVEVGPGETLRVTLSQ